MFSPGRPASAPSGPHTFVRHDIFQPSPKRVVRTIPSREVVGKGEREKVEIREKESDRLKKGSGKVASIIANNNNAAKVKSKSSSSSPPLDSYSSPPPNRSSSSSSSFSPSPISLSDDDGTPTVTRSSRLQSWNTRLSKYPLFGLVSDRTGIPKLYLASFILFLSLLLIFRGTGMSLLTVLVGFIYPLHMSLKTIENCLSLSAALAGPDRDKHSPSEVREKRAEILAELRTWLVYWVVYSLFSTLESLSDFSLSWLPIYHPTKLIFLLWCFLPQYQGSQLVFDVLVKPVLNRHEESIENGVEVAHQAAIFSATHISRVVRARSIQLSNAIQLTGSQLLSSSSSSLSSSSSASSSSTCSSADVHVRDVVAQIDSMSAMNMSSSSSSMAHIAEEDDREEGKKKDTESRGRK